MRHHRPAKHALSSRQQRSSPLFLLLLPAALGVATTGCASLAEDVATHLAKKDVKAIDQELRVFEADLGLFRNCLKQRGGSCRGSDTTALPHSSQHTAGQAVAPVPAGSSQPLADSVARLPAGDPAKSALALLADPVVGQAATLHNHLRGHETGSASGATVEKGRGAHGGPESTVTMNLGIGQVGHFHKRLLSTLGTSAWKRLHDHCRTLLAAGQGGPDRHKLEADCRRAAFVRGYFEAYVRTGEFLEVDVELAGAIRAINQGAAKINGQINALLTDLRTVEADIARVEARTLKEIGTDAAEVSEEVKALTAKVEKAITRRLGKAEAAILNELTRLAGELDGKADALIQAADAALVKGVESLVSDLDGVLAKIEKELGELEDRVSAVDREVVQDITDEVDRVNATLSNVFKVSNVGFVSRDDTFRARLPTLEVTLDPTAERLVTVTDVDTGQILTGKSDLGDLGVATDTSGVGTGSRIGAEVVRVFLEAIFDAHEGLPAVAPANQPNVRPTGLRLGEHSLPLFTSPMGHVDSRDLTRMTGVNDQVAAKTRSILSRVIAGIGPFSLNNPALEELIVEIIATSVRKATAKATWCWYACNLDVDLKALEADAETAAKDEAKKIEDEAKAKEREVEAKAKAKEREVEAKAKAEVEHVKLRLRLSK